MKNLYLENPHIENLRINLSTSITSEMISELREDTMPEFRYRTSYTGDISFYDFNNDEKHNVGRVNFSAINLSKAAEDGFSFKDVKIFLGDSIPDLIVNCPDVKLYRRKLFLTSGIRIDNLLVIDFIYIEPNYRRQGYAKRTLEIIANEMNKPNQITMAEISTFECKGFKPFKFLRTEPKDITPDEECVKEMFTNIGLLTLDKSDLILDEETFELKLRIEMPMTMAALRARKKKLQIM